MHGTWRYNLFATISIYKIKKYAKMAKRRGRCITITIIITRIKFGDRQEERKYYEKLEHRRN